MKMSTEPQRYSLNGETMGTRYTAVFYAEAGVDTDAINRGLAQAVGRVDQQMSTWKADSDLNRLNAGPEQTWLPVPQDWPRCWPPRCGSASNPAGLSTSPSVIWWTPGASVPGAPSVTEQTIDALPSRSGLSATAALTVDTQRHQVRKRAPLHLNLNGIAKGFGVDELARCLDGFGLTRYLVGIDGEMRARGVKPDARTVGRGH